MVDTGVNFEGRQFANPVAFINDTFSDFVNFKNTVLGNSLDIENAIFSGAVNFDGANIQHPSSIFQCDFKDDLSFDFAKLPRYFCLSDVQVNDTAHITFIGTHLPDTFSFGYNAHLPPIDFTYCDYRRGEPLCNIYLYQTDIAKLKLDYTHFRLYFFNYLGAEIDDEAKETVYEQLLKNFKDRGQNESYKLLDMEYQDFKLRSSVLSPLRWIPKYWWNYGYNKELIFLWTFVFLLIFTTFNFFIIAKLNGSVYKIDNVIIYSYAQFWRRLWHAFIYSASIFFGLTLKMERMNFKRIRGSAYILFFYTLGLICLAYLANFVLQKN